MRTLLSRVAVVCLFLACGVVCLVVGGELTWQYLTARERLATQAIASSNRRVAASAARMNSSLESVMPLVTKTANRLSSGALTASGLEPWFRRELGADHLLSGFGVAYQPFAYSPATRLYAPYLERHGRSFHLANIATWYDYTKFKYRWYGDPILEGAMWKAPLFPVSSEHPVAMYCVPFYKPGPRTPNENPAGLVFATVPMGTLTRALGGAQTITAGYYFLFSREGVYLSHPSLVLVHRRRTVFETAWEGNDPTLNSMAIRAIKGGHGYVATHDLLTGQSSWIFYDPLPTTGWTVAAVVFQSDFQPNPDRQRHQLFLVVLLAVMGIAFLTATPLLLRDRGRTALWVEIAGLSLLFTAGTAVLWVVVYSYPTQAHGERVQVYNQTGTDEFLHRYAATSLDGRPAIQIPTGIFVQSIKFLSSSDVTVDGYIWQRYRQGVDDGVRRGFVLPEAGDPTIDKVSDRLEGQDEVVDWHFHATFRQRFSYRTYPLDHHDVWVRMRPVGWNPRVVLVPDFSAYPIMNPVVKPGVDGSLVLPGWTVTASDFDFRLVPYNATFGRPAFNVRGGVPELYFNVRVRRQFLGPFVSNIVPLVVTSAMLFALLLTGTEEERRSALSGFTALDVVLGTAALFFVVSFQHIALRDALASPDLMYFEYFYFITYLALMLVSINAILFASRQRLRLIHFDDNLVPKLLYWPLMTGLAFVLSLVILY